VEFIPNTNIILKKTPNYAKGRSHTRGGR
jgi:hypothetical protein